MRIALIADLHGNLPAVEALEKALARLRADRVWCLGDVIGKGADNRATFDWAFANCELLLGGNWDIGVSERRFPMDAYYWRQLGAERMRRLEELPLEYRFTFAGRRTRLLHGRPVMPELLGVSASSEDLRALFSVGDERFQLVGYADTHRQALRTLSSGRLFNTGSVGNALGVPELCFVLLEADGAPTDGVFVPRGADGGGVPAPRSAFDRGAPIAPDLPPLSITFYGLPYDRRDAVARARAEKDLPRGASFVSEVETGRYARGAPALTAKANDAPGY